MQLISTEDIVHLILFIQLDEHDLMSKQQQHSMLPFILQDR